MSLLSFPIVFHPGERKSSVMCPPTKALLFLDGETNADPLILTTWKQNKNAALTGGAAKSRTWTYDLGTVLGAEVRTWVLPAAARFAMKSSRP